MVYSLFFKAPFEKDEEAVPYELYEIDAIEGWLDEHTRRGLRLKSCRGRCCTFAPAGDGEAMTRYRLDVRRRSGDDPGRREEFRELGWEYVDQLSGRVDVYRAARPDAVEINTDGEALQEVLRRTYLLQAAEGLFCLLAAAIVVFALARQLRRDGGLFPALLGDNPAWLIGGVLLVIYALVMAAFCLVTVIRARRRDQTERSFHTPALARHRRALRLGFLVLLLTINGLRLILGLGSASPGTLEPLPAEGCPLPAWEQICPGEGSVMVSRRERALCNRYLTLRQEDTLRLHDAPAEGPFYRADVYECRWEFLARGLEREKLAGQEIRAVTVDGWDAGWLWQTDSPGGPVQHLLLRSGDRVLTAEYRGAGDLAASAALFAG